MIILALPSASVSYTFPIDVSVSTIGFKCLRALPLTAILLNEFFFSKQDFIFVCYIVESIV